MTGLRIALQGVSEPAETASMSKAPSVVVLDEEDELERIQTLVARLGVDCVRWPDGLVQDVDVDGVDRVLVVERR